MKQILENIYVGGILDYLEFKKNFTKNFAVLHISEGFANRKLEHNEIGIIIDDAVQYYEDEFYLKEIKKGLEFSIQLEDIKIPKTCPLLNRTLIEGDREYTPSLDRIDSKKGYTPDNVWVISHRANQIKNDATIQELKLIAENLEKIK